MSQMIEGRPGAEIVVDEATVWGLKIITQAFGVATRNAPSRRDWELFESIRLRPFAVGMQRQSLRDIAIQLGYQSVEEANSAIVNERRRWLACLYEQLVFEFQFEYGQKAEPEQVYQRMQTLSQIAQRIVESDNQMTEALLQCIHSLQPRFSGEVQPSPHGGMATLSGPLETLADDSKLPATDPSSAAPNPMQPNPMQPNPMQPNSMQPNSGAPGNLQPSQQPLTPSEQQPTGDPLLSQRTSYQEGYQRDQAFFRQIGLEKWEKFLKERLSTEPNQRVVYDARALFLLTEHDAEQGTSTGARPADSPTSSFRATELADELQRILTSRYSSTGVVSESLPAHGPDRNNPTLLELLESPQPHAVTLGHLKEISKNQGPSDKEPWDVLTSKVIYFAAIATFILRISPDPSQITSLPHRSICQAFAWAVSLPWIDIRLRNIIVQAWQKIDT